MLCHPVNYQHLKPIGPKRVEAVRLYKPVNQDGIWHLAATDTGQLKPCAFSKIDRSPV